MLYFDVPTGCEGIVADAIASAISTTEADKGGGETQNPGVLHGLPTLTAAPSVTNELTATGSATTSTGAEVPTDRRISLSTSSSPKDVQPLETGVFDETVPPSVETLGVAGIEQGVPALPEIDKRDFVPNEGTLVGYCEVRGVHHHKYLRRQTFP